MIYFSLCPTKGSAGVIVFSQTFLPLDNSLFFPNLALRAGLALRFLAPQPFPFTFVASDPHPCRYWWPVISGALLILSSSVLWPTTSCFYLLLQTMHSFLSLYLGTFGRLRYLPNSTFFVWGLCTVPCVWRPSLWCCECSYLNGDCFPFRQRCTWASKV